MLEDDEDKEEVVQNMGSAEVDDSDEGGGDEWLATYGDMVTLLLCFFVLMFAMSSVQKESFEQLVQSMKEAIGKQEIPESGTREGLIMKDVPEDQKINALDELGGMIDKDLDNVVSEVRELIMFNKLQGKVRVEKDDFGAKITLSDVLLFPTGKAEMTSAGRDLMKQIQEILKQFSYHVKILGHTDNVPIRTEKFKSNWELSANRACEVVRLLIKQGLDPELLSAEGYAKYRPLAPNDTAEGRAKNRRVEIVYDRQYIMQKKKEISETRAGEGSEPESEGSSGSENEGTNESVQ